jgi:DNA-binding response OmpR family regulator
MGRALRCGSTTEPRRGATVTKILIVEDTVDVADTIADMLRTEGYEVVVAYNGRDGLAAFQRERPDLVILDLILPGGLHGFDVLKAMREYTDVPVIMLTGRDEEVDRVVGIEMGADDYVPKPFSMRELLARVRAVLRRAGIEE